jgi:TPR repeat protein
MIALAAATTRLVAQVTGGAPGANPAGAPKKALTVAEIETLVRAKQAAVLILDKVEQNCLAVALTPADEKTLSAAGAKDDLIAKLKAACVEKAKTTTLSTLLDDSKVTPGVRALEQSCTAGAATACDSAAAKYEEGIYAPQDMHRAAELYLMACSSGIETACDKSINLYDKGKDSADVINAARLMAVQCERNIAKFCLRLGKGFETGRGVPADPVRAGKMYAQACDFGEASGCSKAADALEKPELNTSDFDKWLTMREKACKDGHMESCSKLGDALTNDKRFPKDIARGGDALVRACDLNDLKSCSNVANLVVKKEYAKKDAPWAVGVLAKTCEGGAAVDCVLAGKLLTEGGAIPVDSATAAKRYGAGCDAKNVDGCERAGDLDYALKNYTAAAAHLPGACDAGRAVSCRQLGALLLRAEGKPDTAKAVASLKVSCEKKDGPGCGLLAELKVVGRRADRNLIEARANYQVACDAGVIGSCVDLGSMIATGRGGARDLTAAAALFDKACSARSTRGCVQSQRVKFVTRTNKDGAPFLAQFEEACKNGEMSACGYAADLLMRGEGVGRDEKRAVTLLTTACEKNSADACGDLGDAYQRGAGVNRDRPKAASLFEKACAAGNPHACWNLGKLVLRGDDGITRDGNRALELFKGSCADDDASGCVSLADAYDRGEITNKDRDESNKWYDRACVLGWDDRRCRDKK